VRLQAYRAATELAVAAVVALCAVAYLEVLPRATRWAAFRLSPRLELSMGEHLLEFLDAHGFQPSQLSEQPRASIAEAFARTAQRAAPAVSYRLEFRRTQLGEINAFTLPGGIIIMLDSTAEFCDAIDAASVLGVLGHELGHVVNRHMTRNALQSLSVGAIASLLWGDFSVAATSVPLMLARLDHSRQFETEADEFAVHALRASGLSAQPLSRFFACLQELPEARIAAGIPSFLTSHPPTLERIQRLNAGGEDADASEWHCPARGASEPQTLP